MPGGRDSNPRCDQIIFLFDIFGLGVWYGMVWRMVFARRYLLEDLGASELGVCGWIDSPGWMSVLSFFRSIFSSWVDGWDLD